MENNDRQYFFQNGDIVKIKRKDIDWQDQKLTFYTLEYKFEGESKQTYVKRLKMPEGTDIEDGSKIKLVKIKEFATHNKKDIYTDIWGINVLEYELINGNTTNAINEYKQEIDEADDVIF